MAVKWEEMANEGDHYRLAFDRKNTWSQKYNMVWDKLWNLNLFPNNVIGKKLNYYLTKQNPYGLPLDSRKEYTKSYWIMWTAAMSSDKETFQCIFFHFSNPIYASAYHYHYFLHPEFNTGYRDFSGQTRTMQENLFYHSR